MSAGKIVQIIGAVIDVEFPQDAVPKVYDALKVESGLTLEVQQQLGGGVVRCIALGTSDGLKRGLKVENTGNPIQVPVGTKTLGRIMNVLGEPIDEHGEIGADRTGIGVFNSRAYGEILRLEKVADGVYQGKGKWALANGGNNTGDYADNTHLNLYFYPNTANSEYTINKIKFERGTVATDWTPAPEDAESSVASARAEVKSVSQAVADVNGKLLATHTIKTQVISGGKTAIAGISLGANKEESSVIVMADKTGERVPLTIADYDKEQGTVTVVIQAIGTSTKEMCEFEEGDEFLDFVE